jgi:uroporphyrinogen-III synthase
MNNLKKISNKLNLMYYEYDQKQNKFVTDKAYDKGTIYNDFIKLTYELSKNHIEFFIDEHNDLVITHKDNFISHLKQRCKNFQYMLKGKKKNIYILSDKHVEYAQNLPFISTVPLKTTMDIKQYDALIFTSKNGVTYLNNLRNDWKNIPAYAMSTQTAKKVKDLKGKLKFIGKSHTGNEFANELLPLLQGKKVAYVGAKDVVSDLINILNKNNVTCKHIALYETVCTDYKEKVNLPKNSIIIFSSPSTINCFFKNVNWEDTFTAISIGATTAQYFPKHVTPVIAENTTLQSCVQKALSMS